MLTGSPRAWIDPFTQMLDRLDSKVRTAILTLLAITAVAVAVAAAIGVSKLI